MTGLESVGSALTLIKTIVGIAKDANDIELIDKIIDLQSKLVEVQQVVAGLQNENLQIREENRQLKLAREIESNLEYDGALYWTRKEDGKDGPFCPNCWDAERKLVRPNYRSGSEDVPAHYYCVFHKQAFQAKGTRPF